MKKLISLILVLVLSLTAVAAFAEAAAVPSPNALNEFSISGDDAESLTDGITTEKPVKQETKDVVNNLVKTGDLVENLYKKTTFVGKDGEPTDQKEVENKELTNICIIPFPNILIDEAVVTAEYGEIITPIPAAIGEYLLANKDNIIAFFNYQVTDEEGAHFFSNQVDFEIRKTGDLTYGIVYKIPVEVLKKAQGWPSFVTFELVKE